MKCILCGKTSKSILKIVDGVSIFECKSCKLGFLNRNDIHKSPDHLYDFKDYKKNTKKFRKRLLPLINKIVASKPSGEVLEIGPGYGLLSSLLVKKGNYSLTIVEPSLESHYLEKIKHKHFKADLDIFLITNNKKYDVVIMFDVIEHLQNPLVSLANIKNNLNQKGVFIIQTPNYNSLMQYCVKHWSWWMVEDHKWFFTTKSLTNMLSKEGFSVQRINTYEDWSDFKKNLDGNFLQIKHKIIRKFIKSLFFIFFIPFYFITRNIFWKLGKGGLIFSISKKK